MFSWRWILKYKHNSIVVELTTTYAISSDHYQRCEFEFRSWRGVLDTTLCNKVCQWIVAGRWYSTGALFPPPIKTNYYTITTRTATNTVCSTIVISTVHSFSPMIYSLYVHIFDDMILLTRCIYFLLFCQKVYSIQHYVIKFVSELWQVGGIQRVLCFLHQ
jgi:hypothetical protein